MTVSSCAACGKRIELHPKQSRPPGEACCRACWKLWRAEARIHGATAYNRRGCRCDVCRAAVAEVNRRKWRERDWDRHRICVHCGTSFEASTSRHTCCSAGCQRLRKNELQQSKRRQAQGIRTSRCLVCQKDFQVVGQRGTCSDSCRRKRASQHTLDRKARVRAVFVASVDRQAIFERDGWRCYRCLCRLSKTKPVPHLRAATIDHLIPITRGGTHEPANVKACCYLCNVTKGNRGGNEQLLLIG